MLATVWIRGLKRGGVVYYEKLHRNTRTQLLRMAEMLGIPDVNKDRLDCVLRHNQDNSFKRSESGSKNYPKYCRFNTHIHVVLHNNSFFFFYPCVQESFYREPTLADPEIHSKCPISVERKRIRPITCRVV